MILFPDGVGAKDKDHCFASRMFNNVPREKRCASPSARIMPTMKDPGVRG